MDWILHSVLSLCCLILLLWTPVRGEKMQAEVNTNVTLLCRLGADYRTRTWYQGSYSDSTPPDPSSIIYSQVRSTGILNTGGALPETTLNAETFAMTISPVTLAYDKDNFTCKVFTTKFRSEYHNIQLHVYILPVIQLRGLDDTLIAENTTVNVNCSIAKLYPAIQPSAFTMQWGTETINSTQSLNIGGKIFSYIVKRKKMVTRQDNNKEVTCRVDPVHGKPVVTIKTISVLYISATSPKLSVVKTGPYYLKDEVTYTCEYGAVDANPPPSSVEWFKDGNLLSNWSTDVFQEVFQNTITIGNGDSGLYSCRVRNDAGPSGNSSSLRFNVSSIENPNRPEASNNIIPIAAGGAAGAVVIIFVIILVIVFIRKRGKNKDGVSTEGLTDHGSRNSGLDRVVCAPENNGEAMYSQITDSSKVKPVPAQRSFKRKNGPLPGSLPEPIYDVANVKRPATADNKGLYANVNNEGAEYAEVQQPPKKPLRLHDVANNNAQQPGEALVYAELNLDKRPGRKNKEGIMPRDEEPTEYVQIDFAKSGHRQ